MIYDEYGSIKNIQGLRVHFEKVDTLLEFFLNDEDVDFNNVKQYQIGGQFGSAHILRITKYVFTHEFHHKGQVLSLT